MDKQVALEVLSEVSDFLEGFDFFLDSGTLLGIYRNGDFIDHDTDIDFAIVIDPSKDVVFPTPDWPLVAVWNYRNLPMQRAYMYKGIVVDFYFYYSHFESDLLVNHSDHGVLKLRVEDSLPPTTFEFKDLKVKLPKYPSKVLESEYGNDWIKPKSSKGDWGAERRNLFQEFPLWNFGLEGHIPNELLVKQYSSCLSQFELMKSSLDGLTQQRDELTQQRDELTQQRDELTQQRDELTQQRDVILNSTIWKATRPIRWFVNQFKR